MPTHNSIELLVPALQGKIQDVLDEANADPSLKELGVDSVVISESLRDVDVQMAYRARGLYSEVIAAAGQATADALKSTIVRYVQAMYQAAGLYAIDAASCLIPNTWTLQSAHLGGGACDVAPKKGEKLWWAAPEAVWVRIGEIGESHGLLWGGRFPGKKRDCPHLELKR